METEPLFTILTPIYHPDLDHFEAMLDSVASQDFSGWEHVLVFDGPHERTYQRAVASRSDVRMRTVDRASNGGISIASNDGLATANGAFVVLLDHDDLLAPHALSAVRDAVERYPDADVLYSDEDKLDRDGKRREPFCKPQFSPEWLRCHMYVNHLGVYRRSLVEHVGGFRAEFDGAQDHDLALRTTELARRVVHIPRILYHWRQVETSTAVDPESKSWAYDAGVRVVQAALDRQEIPATAVSRGDLSGIVHIEPTLVMQPLVSVIVPTAGSSRLVVGEETRLVDLCLRSIRDETSYEHFEVIVVLDQATPSALVDELGPVAPPGTRFVRNPRPFNFSEACNIGRDHARGDVLVFLNDDTEVVTPRWLERLALFAGLDGVGAVGAKLLYSDGRLQHIGLVTRHGVGHRGAGLAGDSWGTYGSYCAQTNVLCVTGACLAVRAGRFDSVGGFTKLFPLAFNDIDLCLKLYRAGLRTVLDPQVVLIHHESSSRDPAVTDHEVSDLFHRWRYLLENDPYDNPHTRHPEQPNMEQLQPPAQLLMLKEMVGADICDPRPWPPSP